MRFKKGSKVEILGKNEGLPVEWRCARIISGNGRTYSVQYDCSSMTSEEASVDRVQRKAIRPCPPLIEGTGSWKSNDLVEVYDAGSWRAATVLKSIGGDFYLARLWLSCKKLKVHKVDMRVRQFWQDDQWTQGILNPVALDEPAAGKTRRNLISNNYTVMPEVQQARNSCLPGSDASGLLEPHLTPPSTVKRVFPYGSSLVEDYPRKRRLVVNNGECDRIRAPSTAPLLEKVDAIAYPQNNMGEKYLRSSFTHNTKQYYEIREGSPCTATEHFLERIEEPDYSCGGLSSVGSCSVTSCSSNKFFSDTLAGPSQDEDALCSDAESVDVGIVDGDTGCTVSPKEVVPKRIHRLELHAYYSMLEAMYTSGPLSWEQEGLLTNLRISLNISNDEHLMGIKKLVSSSLHF